jgi:hypothetical protein
MHRQARLVTDFHFLHYALHQRRYIEASVTWRGDGDNLNISIATTVDDTDNTKLTLTAKVNNDVGSVNVSDFLIVFIPSFEHGRGGGVAADSTGVSGVSDGLRTTHLHLMQGAATVPTNTTLLPNSTFVAVAFDAAASSGSVVLSTDKTMSLATIAAKTMAYEAREAATLTPYKEWAEVKDAMQTSLMWSFTYDPKEGLVAPVTKNWVRCAFFGRNVHSRMPLDSTHVRLKRTCL